MVDDAPAPVSAIPGPAITPALRDGGFGRRSFILGAAGTAGALVGASMPSQHVAAASDPLASAFRVVNPTRLVDTRPGFETKPYDRIGTKQLRVPITGIQLADDGGIVPEDATAAVFTLVGINRSNDFNYLSAFPSGTTWNGTANLNVASLNDASANLVTVALGQGGAATRGHVDVLWFANCDVVLDLVGVYTPTRGEPSREGRYQQFSKPRRVLSTRDSDRLNFFGAKPEPGQTVRVDLQGLVATGQLASDATAVVANVTAVQASDRGFITAYPFGTEQPSTSTLNVQWGETRGIGSLVKVGTDAQGRLGFNLYTDRGAHLIVDIAGSFTGPSANLSTTGLFVPIDPVRLLDTRRGDGGKKRLWPGWSRAFTLPASFADRAQAIAMNLAAARTMGGGYFTLLAAQTRRELVSNLNVTAANQVISNHAITQVSDKGVECYSSAGGDIICDAVGYYQGQPVPHTGPVPIDPPPPAAPTPYIMEIPRLGRTVAAGLAQNVLSGSSIPIVDSGQVWHWTGTGLVGQGLSISTFAHRTDAGGPWRQIHTMGAGDRVTMHTGDFRAYVYEYDSREVTGPEDPEILVYTQGLNQQIGVETLSLVACTVGFDTAKGYPSKSKWDPTSLKFRIIVRLRLVEWIDTIPVSG